MSIPLVQEATKDAINTSIIAIKRNIERINMLLGLVDSGSSDLSGLATKQELEDAITQVETDLAPVDEVTSGNMQSVTSNAVASALDNLIENYYTLVQATAIPTSAYTTISFINNRKLSDYDFIDFYVGLYESSIFYPRGFCRVPSLLFKNYTETNRIYRIDIPLVGSNNENVSFRYKTDETVDCRAFNTSTTFYARILGEKIFNN